MHVCLVKYISILHCENETKTKSRPTKYLFLKLLGWYKATKVEGYGACFFRSKAKQGCFETGPVAV